MPAHAQFTADADGPARAAVLAVIQEIRASPATIRKSVFKKGILCIAEASGHEVNHGEIDHGLARFSQFFIVFAETAIPSQPSEGSFDHPAVRKYFEPAYVVASPDDFQ